MRIQDLSQRVSELIEMGNKALTTKQRSQYTGEYYINAGAIKGFRSASLSFIHRFYGATHPHYKEFDNSTEGYYPSHVEEGIGILNAIYSEIAGNWLFTIKELVAAELFTNFIEMAEHFLEKGYKDPAAVIAGSVLEEHLRQICIKNSIAIEENKDNKVIPKKADRLNNDLATEGIYSQLDKKNITSWLELRNKAAHGKYDEYNQDQVKNMISAITEFMSRMVV